MSKAFLSGIYVKKTEGYQEGFDKGYQEGFDKGVEDGGEGKPEEIGRFDVSFNGYFTYVPEEDGNVFSRVIVNVNVPTDELTPSKGLEFRQNNSANYGVIDMGSCEDTVVVVPCATEDGYPVESIGSDYSGTFGNNDITDLILPDTVTKICYAGINYASNLKYIKFGRYFSSCVGDLYVNKLSGTPPTNVTLDFSKHELSVPPVLGDTSLLTGVTLIIVPASMKEAWRVADEWEKVAGLIKGTDEIST